MEILTESFNCFDAKNYKALLIIDPEDYFNEGEVFKLRDDLEEKNLSLIIIADWYNQDVMARHEFFNNNTFEYWVPFMAGANIPSLNYLL